MKIKPFLIAVCSVSIVGIIASSLFAQKPSPSPAQPAKPAVQSPDMGAMMNQMMNAMFNAQTSPEHAAQLAHFQKVYYDALVKEGFTKDEALSIIKATQLPTMGAK